jgi:hypothetical protein
MNALPSKAGSGTSWCAGEENLRAWREPAKYLWHRLQALQPLWPAVLDELTDQAHALADSLGDDHDLAILRQQLQAERGRSPGGASVETLVGLIDRRRAELQKQAWAVGSACTRRGRKRSRGACTGTGGPGVRRPASLPPESARVP